MAEEWPRPNSLQPPGSFGWSLLVLQLLFLLSPPQLQAAMAHPPLGENCWRHSAVPQLHYMQTAGQQVSHPSFSLLQKLKNNQYTIMAMISVAPHVFHQRRR